MSKRGWCLLIYGDTGIGKTSTALNSPAEVKCISINETGYEDLEDVGEVPGTAMNVNVDRYVDLKREIANMEEQTLVIDNLSGLQDILFQYVIDEEFDGDESKFYAYYTGPRLHVPRHWPDLEHRLRDLRNRGVNIILIGHLRIEEAPNPMGKNYLTKTVDLDKGIRAEILKWSQNILYFDLSREVDKSASSKVPGKASTLKDESERIAYTTISPGHEAKNRMHLPHVIHLGESPQEAWENIYENFPEVYKD